MAFNVKNPEADRLLRELTAVTGEAWRRFGKGRHRAALNLGDCFSYALAAHLEVPLLCVGDDFARTDLTLVDVTRS